ncbi:hypothetical protein D9619_007265 [Psilocybe cf. subviscida]|uniref:Non-haem dioxygenase N-terminal domain-containing protein n=1 Tax=Psilocybe cf. subviscida TaxID=2480587 RepID=A0A8H5B1C7_9AGAR|nr:hypothetical protein D9619_007265 [Psilocybe cf. subviscida]
MNFPSETQASAPENLGHQAATVDQRFKDVPVIDLSHIRSTDFEDRQRLAETVRDACMRVGFFYVKNHGIDAELPLHALEQAKAFFALPLDRKMEIENKKSPNFKGYSPLLSGNNNPLGRGDVQEGFEFGWEDPTGHGIDKSADGVMHGSNVWPSEGDVPHFHEDVIQYYFAAVDLGKALFPIFALALNLPEDYFEDKTRYSAALMKLLHYPPQYGPVDDRLVGIGAHTE